MFVGEVSVVSRFRQALISIHPPVHLLCHHRDLSFAQLALINRCTYTTLHTKLSHLPPYPMENSSHFAGFLSHLSLFECSPGERDLAIKCLSKTINVICLDLVSPRGSPPSLLCPRCPPAMMRTWNILPGITDTIYLNQKQETRNKRCLSLCNCSIMLPYNHVKVPAGSHALALVLSEDQHLLAMVKVGISHPLPVWDWGQAESWGTGTTFSRSLSSSSNPTHSESEWKPSACSCNCRDLFRFSSISPFTEIKSDMEKAEQCLECECFSLHSPIPEFVFL